MTRKRRSCEEEIELPPPKSEQNGGPPTSREKAWAVVRLVLGFAQMMGATVSVYLLIELGVVPLSLGSVVVTPSLTTLSVLLFGRRKS